MKRTAQGISILLVLVASSALVAPPAMAQRPPIPITVNCSNGQSLNSTLAQLNKHSAFTVVVSGTCTEFVHVADFQDLTLKGVAGATLVQPSTGAGNLVNAVLLIESSQSVAVDGLNIQADATTPVNAIAIGHGSGNIQLRNLNVTGGTSGISIFEHSQVLLADVTARDSSWAPLGVYDLSDVHIEHCAFGFSTGAPYQPGIYVGASHITMFDTDIKNMRVGISGRSSNIDVMAYSTYTPPGGPTDVIIENPLGTNYEGVQLLGGSSLNVSARLVIRNAGQSWGGTSAGVFVGDGSTLTALDSKLVITGSQGQGIMVTNNSHATLSGVTVTGSGHGGLVAANHGSIDVTAGTPSQVSGNAVDLFILGTGILTGSANISGASNVQAFGVTSGPFDSGGLP